MARQKGIIKLRTTHFKIISAGSVVDFENETFEVDTQETAEIALDSVATVVISLVNNVTPNSVPPMFLALGIIFYQEVNGVRYVLKNGSYNALSLVKVNGV
ncbi:MAG: hypothetical protein JWP81_587 [Ferruginibacter sp.]|nr:hypothetical protein [Ferruginibacter sp.]